MPCDCTIQSVIEEERKAVKRHREKWEAVATPPPTTFSQGEAPWREEGSVRTNRSIQTC
jgi:hypothetical protein